MPKTSKKDKKSPRSLFSKKVKGSPHRISTVLQTNNNRLLGRMRKLLIVFIVDLILLIVCAVSASNYSDNQKKAIGYLLDIQKWAFAAEDYIEGEADTFEYDIHYAQQERDEFLTSLKGQKSKRIAIALEENSAVVNKSTEFLFKSLREGEEDNPERAAVLYSSYVWPSIEILQENLNDVVELYSQMVRENNLIIFAVIILAIAETAIIAIPMFRNAKKDCIKTAEDISKPIEIVSDLAKRMSDGDANIDADTADIDNITLDEAKEMLIAFKEMAASIAQNVDVVKRVADGDMTAFVNIRSEEDSLGKNLYRMVQNNDIMFANVARIAEGVAEQIGYIATANTSLAEGCNKQAQIVTDFIEKIDGVSEIITETNQKTNDSLNIAHTVKDEVENSAQKMEELKNAMEEIKGSSERISAVIANIEDIASQTNLLSLNASIEAARAGEAGRGFAVVATSIGELAKQSAELSQESKKLIEDTVSCTARGNDIANGTFEAFEVMNRNIDDIVTATEDVASRSVTQKEYMEALKEGVGEISDTVKQNAEFSEETASMSDEIIRSSDKLKESISKFNLRQRVAGQPYIPPEKENDPEFIKEATENYKRYKEANPYGDGM